MAIALNRKGYDVGILDADITGPSIPRMFGVNERPELGEGGILPVLSKSGIGIMSINLLLPSEDDAVIWRGPLIGRAINQFQENVVWGKLDFLIIDLPPGTADAPLTVLQSFQVSGVIIVFTPQNLTAMIVRKAVNMAKSMNKPILGVVENMAYLYVAEIDKKIELFGKSHGEEMSKSTGAPLLGQLPIDPELAKLCDEGNIERYDADVVGSLGESLIKALAAKAG
jgi:Mrp family chromosome partitioning ATPase